MKEEIDINNIIDKYADMINRIIYRHLKSKEDTEDVVQEVFIKYMKYVKAGNIFNTDEHEKCWLVRVTLNLCRNELKYNKMRMTMPLNDYIYFDLDISSENLLIVAVNKLEKKYRETFELFYFDDLKISEISKILKISEANVKTRLKRARDKVKEYMMKGERVYGKV